MTPERRIVWLNAAAAAAGVAAAGWLLLRTRARKGFVFEFDSPFDAEPGDQVSFAVRRDEDGCKVDILDMTVSDTFDASQLLPNALLAAYASGMITPGQG